MIQVLLDLGICTEGVQTKLALTAFGALLVSNLICLTDRKILEHAGKLLTLQVLPWSRVKVKGKVLSSVLFSVVIIAFSIFLAMALIDFSYCS